MKKLIKNWLAFSIFSVFLLASCSAGESEPTEIQTITPTITASPVPTNTATPTPIPTPTATPMAGGEWIAFMDSQCYQSIIGNLELSVGNLYLVNLASLELRLINNEVRNLQDASLIYETPNDYCSNDTRYSFSLAPDGNKLVYGSYKEGNWAFYQIDLATMEEIKLSDLPGQPTRMIWTTDNEWLVFAINGSALGTFNFIEGSLNNLGIEARWGHFSLIPQPASFSFHNNQGALMRYDLSSGKSELLSDALNGHIWSSRFPWHPDGNSYLVSDRWTEQLFLLDINTQEISKVLPHYTENQIISTVYDYSSDGSRILVQASYATIYPGNGFGLGDWGIYLMDSTTYELKLVIDTAGVEIREGSPIWSPDERWIAYLQTGKNRSFPAALYAFNLETQDRILLTVGLEHPGPAIWFKSSVLP